MMVDLAIVVAVGGLAAIPVLLSGERGWGALGLLIVAVAAAVAVGFVAQTVVGAMSGRSPGQRLLRLRVVTAPRAALRVSSAEAAPTAIFPPTHPGPRA